MQFDAIKSLKIIDIRFPTPGSTHKAGFSLAIRLGQWGPQHRRFKI